MHEHIESTYVCARVYMCAYTHHTGTSTRHAVPSGQIMCACTRHQVTSSKVMCACTTHEFISSQVMCACTRHQVTSGHPHQPCLFKHQVTSGHPHQPCLFKHQVTSGHPHQPCLFKHQVTACITSLCIQAGRLHNQAHTQNRRQQHTMHGSIPQQQIHCNCKHCQICHNMGCGLWTATMLSQTFHPKRQISYF